MTRQLTILCLAVALSTIAAGTTIASPADSWSISTAETVVDGAYNTFIQLEADSAALRAGEKLEMLSRTWGNPTDPTTWIALANGGYIKSVTMGLLAEPVISLDFLVTAGSADVTFTITSALLSFPTINNAEGTASVSVTVTDQNGDGATLTGLYSGKAYEATYNNGVSLFADLVPLGGGPIVVGPGQIPNTQSEGLPPWQAMGTLSNMQASYKFTLSAYDSASATSTYTTQGAVPEPGSLVTLLGSIAGLAGFAYRRRQS